MENSDNSRHESASQQDVNMQQPEQLAEAREDVQMQEVEHKHSVGIEIKAPAEEEVKSVPIQKLDQSEKASAVQEQLDQRTKLQQTLKKLLIQMKRGCSKAVCFSKHCLKNAF